jgi:hypothetical protein
MPLDANRLKAAMKSAVDAIDDDNGSITNDDIIQAIADAVVTEVKLATVTVTVVGGSSSGVHMGVIT